MMRSLRAILGADGLDLLSLSPEMQRVQQIQLIFLGIRVEANNIGGELTVDIAII